ncbi:MAG: tetratricopeptide repeat protein [Gammaproteobacteria bacterium]
MDSINATDAEYARLLKDNPLLPDLWRLRARTALQYQRNNDAIELLKEGLGHLPEHVALMTDLAHLYLLTKDPISARPIVETLLKSEENKPEYILNFARLLWLDGDYEQALAYFKKALATNSGNSKFALNVAQAYISLGRIKNALELLQSWRHQSPSGEMMALLALCEFDVSGMASAYSTVIEGLRMHPLNPTINYLQAVLLSLSGDPDKAEICIAKVRQDEQVNTQWISFLFARESGRNVRFNGLSSTLLASATACAPVTGLVLEFGVYHGLSLCQLAELTRGPVHGFDSFEGLPENWKSGEPAGSYSAYGRLPTVPPQAVLHPGWFKDTLPGFVGSQTTEKVRLMHIDCDLYTSTCTVLKEIYPLLQIGTVIVFDEYLGFPGYEQHEFRAWHEFSDQFCVGYEYIVFTLMAKKAVLRITKL